MADRLDLKQKEEEFLAKESEKSPELFIKRTFIDNAEILNKFGIFIENQEKLPLGFIKFFPSDFIVEEVSQNEEIYTVDYENVIAKNTLIEDAPTIYTTLVKCNLTTLEAVSEFQEFLDCESSQIGYSGIKDKNAITSQRLSFRNVSEIRFARIESPFYFLKDIAFGKGVIDMGGIKGNKFSVLIRTDENFNSGAFLKNLEKINKEGFYNFYYLQRFGSPRLMNYFWAVLILRGKFKEAIEGFLTDTSEREMLYFQQLRQKIKINLGNWREIRNLLSNFPLILSNEIKVVEYLEDNPTDFRGALAQIPEQITLWIYALSSLLFNKKLSQMIENKKDIPEKLPLFLSQNKDDWLFYKDFLEEFKIFPPVFKNLHTITHILLKERREKTKEKVVIYKSEIIKEGVILEFFLEKAIYATTFLAHLFNLVSGAQSLNISNTQIDLKTALGRKPITETLNYFEKITKKENPAAK